MAYWGAGAHENDRGSGSIGVTALWIRQQLEAACVAAASQTASEQSIVALLVLLRLLGQEFPKELSIHVGRRTFESAKSAFNDWYRMSSGRIPVKHRDGVLRAAEAEFQRWEDTIFAPK